MLEPEDAGILLILSADGELTAITLEAFRGDMDPSVLPEVFSLKGVQSFSEKQDFYNWNVHSQIHTVFQYID